MAKDKRLDVLLEHLEHHLQDDSATLKDCKHFMFDGTIPRPIHRCGKIWIDETPAQVGCGGCITKCEMEDK